MSERNMPPSFNETRKFLFCLFCVSIFLLILSGIFLLGTSNNSFIPDSVLIMLVNNTSELGTNANINANKLPNLSSVTSPPVILNTKRISRTVYNVRQSADANDTIRISGNGSIKRSELNRGVLKVFMYDLPSEFHFGLLGWKGKGSQVWPDVNVGRIPEYPGGLNLQHSIEYWLTLDLLSSNALGIDRPLAAVRVKNSSEADVFFVPFFSSISYNRYSKLHGKEKVSKNKLLQNQLVEFLMSQQEWKRYGGKDHLIVAHHPNSMLDVRKKLGQAIFVLADFGRYPVEIANIEKDIIAPYRHVVRTIDDESATFDTRPILMYFQGAIYRKDGGIIRQELYYLLKDERDVHFAFGSVQGNGISRAGQGMASSKFCLNIAGDTPSSNRLFDAIASHCIPVIISDDIELPFEDVLDYSEFCVFVRATDAVKKGFLVNLLRGIKRDEWTRMWERLKQIAHHFEYQYPSQPGDAVQMIWKAVAHKISSVQFKLHREGRFHRSRLMKKGNLG